MRTQKLAECCTFFSGGTPAKGKEEYWRGDIPWFSPKDIKNFDLTVSQDCISASAIESSATRLIEPGTILVVGRSGVLAHTLPVGIVRQPSTFNQDIKAIVPDASYDSEFVALYLKAKQDYVLKDGVKRGPTVHSLIADFIENLEIPQIAIEQQRQIAARLKAQLAEVDKARQAAEAQLRDTSLLITRYRENSIKQLEDVPRVPLGELLHGIEAGKSFQTTELIALPDELGVLKVSAVSWNEFLPQEAKAVEGEYQPDERHKIKKGDLIISRANTLELVGAVVRVADDYPMRLLSDKTLRLVVNEEKALPDYLLTVLKLPEARLHIENNATGTSDSMRNISQKTINSIPIPVLTVDKQRELIKHFSQFNEEIVLIQKSGNAMLNDINLLPRKILAQAFEEV
jgi:type I restriction enzyme S subunit